MTPHYPIHTIPIPKHRWGTVIGLLLLEAVWKVLELVSKYPIPLSTSLWSHLCEARNNLTLLKKRYRTGLKTIASTIVPLVILQVCLAPWYVPIVFGEQRKVAIPVLMVICLSAIPRPFFLATSHLLNALDKTKTNLFWSVLFTVIYGISILVGVQFGVLPVATAVLMSQFLITPLFVFWVTRRIFKPATSL